jgi:TIR domain-containing protein
MKTIFISYRRHDSRWQARMIYDALQRVLPRERLFMDIDSIPPGADFVEILEGWVGACEIMLALIGAGWIDAADSKTGRRRLDNLHDFVRIEIREALRRGIPVVPVLLDDASIPDADELPDDLRSLVRRQVEFVQFRTFDADVARLMKKLGLASADAMAAEARQRAAEEERQARERQAQERQAQERQAQEQKLRSRIPVLVGGRNASQTRWLARRRRAVLRPRWRPRNGRGTGRQIHDGLAGQ